MGPNANRSHQDHDPSWGSIRRSGLLDLTVGEQLRDAKTARAFALVDYCEDLDRLKWWQIVKRHAATKRYRQRIEALPWRFVFPSGTVVELDRAG